MRPQGWFYSLFFLILTVPPLDAGVVRVEIASRQEVSSGKAFGYVGVYERVTGRVFFSVPVANAHNRSIVDLDKAVNLNYGAVEFSADFMALRPKDSSKSNGSWLLEIPNRGRGRIVSLVDGGDWDVDRAVNPEGYKPLVCRSIYYRERRSPRSNPALRHSGRDLALSTKYPFALEMVFANWPWPGSPPSHLTGLQLNGPTPGVLRGSTDTESVTTSKKGKER